MWTILKKRASELVSDSNAYTTDCECPPDSLIRELSIGISQLAFLRHCILFFSCVQILCKTGQTFLGEAPRLIEIHQFIRRQKVV
jgi:hypothetical protein